MLFFGIEALTKRAVTACLHCFVWSDEKTKHGIFFFLSKKNMENTPAASFQRFCQVMLDGSSKKLTKKNLEDFRVILHMIMHECSKANIEVYEKRDRPCT